MFFHTFSFMFLFFFPCVLAVMSVARHMLMAWNEVGCNFILRESLNGGFVEAGSGGAAHVLLDLQLHSLCLQLCGNEEQQAQKYSQSGAHLEAVIGGKACTFCSRSNEVFSCVSDFSASAPKFILLNTLAPHPPCSVLVRTFSKHKGVGSWVAGSGLSPVRLLVPYFLYLQEQPEAHAAAT